MRQGGYRAGLIRLTVAIGLIVGMAVGASNAGAAGDVRPAVALLSTEAQPGKTIGGIVPHVGAKAGISATPGIAAAGGGFDRPPTPGGLTYHGGHVMHTTKVRHVFWVPPGYALSANYQALIDQFMSDVAADSGKTSNIFSSDTQYTDTFTGHILYSLAFGGSVLITDQYPADATTSRADCPLAGRPACLTDTQLEQKLEQVVAAQGWPMNTYTNGYAIFTPPGVDVCVDWAGSPFNRPCTYNAFCAYHTWGGFVSTVSPPPIIYEPAFAQDGSCNDPSFTSPSGNFSADITINTLNHEVNEFITDPTPASAPFGAWYDAGGEENADKCAYNYGTRIGMTPGGALYNQLINGHPYMLQRSWSNAVVPGTGATGCYSIGAPTITNIAPLGVNAGDDVGIAGTNFFFPFGSTPVVKFNGIASPTVTVDSPTHLTAEVPAGNASGKVTVQGTVGGDVVSTQSVGVKPTVTFFSVSHGFTGINVFVAGSGFIGTTSVKINGVPGTFSGISAAGNTMTFTIPAAATSGPITVTNPFGTGSSADPGGAGTFTVDPKITSFTPTSGWVGQIVTLTGSGFGLFGEPQVSIGGVSPTITMYTSPNKFQFPVPPGAVTNPITITVGSAAPFTTATAFKVLPTIAGYSSGTAREGEAVTITGTTFSGATSVKFGAVSVPAGDIAVSGDGTSIDTHVPVGALTGPVTVVTPGGTATGPVFKVLPTIDESFAPTHGFTGTVVHVTGKTFTGTTAVKSAASLPSTRSSPVG
jgi:hypothetical protein